MKNNPLTPRNAPVPGIYKHYKGNLYQVLGTARHSETEEWMVVYQALYKEQGFWVRPLSIWLEPVSNSEQAESLPARFELVTPNLTSLEELAKDS